MKPQNKPKPPLSHSPKSASNPEPVFSHLQYPSLLRHTSAPSSITHSKLSALNSIQPSQVPVHKQPLPHRTTKSSPKQSPPLTVHHLCPNSQNHPSHHPQIHQPSYHLSINSIITSPFACLHHTLCRTSSLARARPLLHLRPHRDPQSRRLIVVAAMDPCPLPCRAISEPSQPMPRCPSASVFAPSPEVVSRICSPVGVAPSRSLSLFTEKRRKSEKKDEKKR